MFLCYEQGLPKRQLLKDVLGEISNNVHAQRLYTEFSEQLSYVEEQTWLSSFVIDQRLIISKFALFWRLEMKNRGLYLFST